MASAFDTLRVTLGDSAGPELVAHVQRLSLVEVDTLAEAILDLPRSAPLPQRPVTEVWPLIPLRASLFFDHLNNESPASGYSPTGVQLSAATDPRLGGTGVFSDGIVRALLYSHGLAIEDPLSHAAEMHLSQHKDVREISRHGIVAATASLSEIAPLLDAGVVDMFYTGGDELDEAGDIGGLMLDALESDGAAYSVDQVWDEFEVEFISGLTQPRRELWSKVRGGDRAPDLDLVRGAVAAGDQHLAETFIDVVRILSPRNVVENAVTSTACTLATIARLGGSSDILAASPLMARLLFLGAPDPAQQLRVHELGRIPVPNVDRLKTEDLVAIRRDSDALATWRDDLADALDYAQRVRTQGAAPSTVQAGVTEMLEDARLRLHREAGRSQLWNKSNLISFVAGALSGAGGGVVGGTAGGMAGGAVAGVLGAVVQAAGGRRPVPNFLDRHYVAFSRNTDTYP